MSKYNFSKLENRANTMALKWDMRRKIFGREDILPMWVADSDWQTAPEIKNELIKRAEHGIFGYSFAAEEIKDSTAGWLKKRFDLKINEDWLIFDTGVVPAINFTLKAITEAGDGVIIQPPVYRPFFGAVKNNKCSLVENELLLKDGHYQIDFEDLEKTIAEWKEKGKNLKAMIFCSPHNPVGRVWKEDEIIKLLRILKREDIYLLSDEIHADLVYSDFKHYPALKIVLEKEEFKDYRERLISFMAASKTFNIAGLHTSYTIIESEKLRKRYNTAKGGFGTGNSPFGLLALKAAYLEGEEWLEEQLDYLEGNYNYLQDFISKNIPQIKVTAAEGTYLSWLDCSQLNFDSDQELIDFMNNKAQVGMNPGIWFGKAGSMFMRLNIACPRQRLKEGLERIKKAVEKRG